MKLTPIKYQEGWLYVDESVDKHNGLFYDGLFYVNGGIGFSVGVHEGEMPKNDYCSKVVAQRNLSLPNIPYIEVEEDLDNIVNLLDTPEGLDQYSYDEGFREGYKAASAKKWSDEDIRKAYRHGTNKGAYYSSLQTDEDWDAINHYNETEESELNEFIQSLNQPKENIEIEMRNNSDTGNNVTEWVEPVTYQKDGKTFLKVKQ